jgi:hypothetical protein
MGVIGEVVNTGSAERSQIKNNLPCNDGSSYDKPSYMSTKNFVTRDPQIKMPIQKLNFTNTMGGIPKNL